MPTSKSASADPAAARIEAHRAMHARADALCRTASECCRQHARHARLVGVDAGAAEQRAACRILELCDGLLAELAGGYARVAASGAASDAPGWHEANMMLHATREYLRHQMRCDNAARGIEAQNLDELQELQVEYELGASALLALQRAVDAYKKTRPEASVGGNGTRPHPSPVA
jgi:hypothetical protein